MSAVSNESKCTRAERRVRRRVLRLTNDDTLTVKCGSLLHSTETCSIALEPMHTYELDFCAPFCLEPIYPHLKCIELSCGHRFSAMALIWYWLTAPMRCPMCRRAYPTPDTCTTLSLELLQVPASVRRDLRSRMLSVRVQDRRDDDDEARAATSLMRSSFDDGDAMLLSDMENLVYARVVVERQVNRSMSGSASSSYVIVTIPLAPRAAQDASSLDANGSNLAQRDDRRHFVQIASRYFPTPRLWLGTRASTQTGSGEVNAPLMESSRDLGTAQSVDSVSLFHDTGAAEAATDVVSDVDARTSEQRGRGIPRVELEVPHRLLGIVSRLFSDNETHRVLCCHVEVLIDVGSSPLAEMPSVDRFISIMKFDFRPDVEDGRTNISYGAHLTAAQQTRFSVVPSLVEENYDRVEINHNVMGWGSSTRLALTRHRATERVEQNLVAMTISVDPHIVRMVRLFSSVFLETGSSV